MALKRNERYPGRYSNPTTDHPQGAFKNRTAPSAQDGSYLEQDWTNDWDGFFGRLLTVAGITPNGNVDTALASQYYDALKALYLQRTNPFEDIKTDGTVNIALENLGLGELAAGVAVVGDSRNAKMSIPAASATATFTADALIVAESLSGKLYRLSSVNKTINLTTTGAGGMDTGTVPATGYVAIYVIYNSTTGTSALLAVNSTSTIAPQVYGGANMPTGYTASALVSVWGIAASQFVVGSQLGRHINIISYTAYNSSAAVLSYTALPLAGGVPQNAKSADMQTVAAQSTANSAIAMYVASTANGVGATYVTASAVTGAGATSTNCGYKTMDIIDAQTLYFKMANTTTATYSVICGGYTI